MPAIAFAGVQAARTAPGRGACHDARVDDRRQQHLELDVGQRARVPDPVLVRQRVPGDAAGDGERERDPPHRGHVDSQSAHEQDAAADGRDARGLDRRCGDAEDRDSDDQDQHGRDASRQRVDDAHVGPRVGRDQERDVCELEERCGRRDRESPRSARARRGSRSARRRSCPRRVATAVAASESCEAREQQVPGGVQHRRRQGEDEGGDRHPPSLPLAAGALPSPEPRHARAACGCARRAWRRRAPRPRRRRGRRCAGRAVPARRRPRP